MNTVSSTFYSNLKKFWSCKTTWKRSSTNTLWCLLGCSIGDLGTIGFFQLYEIQWQTGYIMLLAMVNGILTSIILETFVLLRQMGLRNAFKVAIGMSLISMIAMELAMNLMDLLLTGGAKLNFFVVPIMLISGFCVALPYNYWRLKALGKSCH